MAGSPGQGVLFVMNTHIAIPVMNEPGIVGRVQALARQSVLPARVVLCVNQPASYFDSGDPFHQETVRVNATTLTDLQALAAGGSLPFGLTVIDRSSAGRAWPAAQAGVGRARREAMDEAAAGASGTDLLLCMDADTVYPPHYIEAMRDTAVRFPEAAGIAGAYFHPVRLAGRRALPEAAAGIRPDLGIAPTADALSAAALHYEVYMRAYALGLAAADLPYAYTAIGSSMGCTAAVYRKIGGLPPHKSGEDFYFLQKLAKSGPIVRQGGVPALPAPRPSPRVIFGTGPAIGMGLRGEWDSCPVYPAALFADLQRFYAGLETFYTDPAADLGPVGAFAIEKWGADWHVSIRRNRTSAAAFRKACTEKFDALRILQYLKAHYAYDPQADALNLLERLRVCARRYPGIPSAAAVACLEAAMTPAPDSALPRGLDRLSVSDWQALRLYLYRCERAEAIARPLVG
ncbi:MAG: glycosyltransferase family 2 protein [Bacteroidales bacterium]|nr:glycosyltransferase family 2 protein [Bacteroidales bacterium]